VIEPGRIEHRALHSSGAVDRGAPCRLVVDTDGGTHGLAQVSGARSGGVSAASCLNAPRLTWRMGIAPWDPVDNGDRRLAAGSPGLPPGVNIPSTAQSPLPGGRLFAAALSVQRADPSSPRAIGHRERYAAPYGPRTRYTEVAQGRQASCSSQQPAAARAAPGVGFTRTAFAGDRPTLPPREKQFRD
jgi:hypothetical protein